MIGSDGQLQQQPLFHGFRRVDRMGNYNGNGKSLSTDFADDRG
jgi:hypothetical protein